MAQAPLDPNQPSVFVGLKIVESMAASIDEIAAAERISRSAAIRLAVQYYLDQQEAAVSA